MKFSIVIQPLQARPEVFVISSFFYFDMVSINNFFFFGEENISRLPPKNVDEAKNLVQNCNLSSATLFLEGSQSIEFFLLQKMKSGQNKIL